jgi:hypothetical protein
LSDLTPTAKEAEAIKALKALARKWPKTLWLFSASGTLCVMRAGPDGGRIHHPPPDNGIDPAYMLDTISTPNDGGDW